ncbi:glycosyltransferase [Gordonia sp. ABSL1-1]|uniref:glycosyltransferase n=1 Tax=Gordonia sp. ABSL1-1 TaxID=3053923 RepID=UPI0025734B99|nr:nucleotide disphospho-sugar-binding domain-containing protein [Gordonia sp. ABSL1-1]MDL9938242.1 glycosyltransferase [Gordonia sp. ABSL1-1]
MPELLFVTADAGGNVQPMVDIARASRSRGAAVRVIGHEQLRKQVERGGLEFVPYVSTKPWDSVKEQSPLWWPRMLNDRGIGRDVAVACADRRPDAVVVDCFLNPAHAVVHDLGIPLVVLTHTVREYIYRTTKFRYLGAATPAYLYGYQPNRLWDSADLNIVTAERELDPARGRRQPTNLEWVGAVLPPAVEAVAEPSPHVLVSLSTNGFPGQDKILRRIIAALGTLDVRATVTTGDVYDPADFDAPDNVTVTGFADHGELMRSTSLLIGHGGHSTTFRALAHGIPVIVMPANPLLDQRMIGVALRDAGLGQVLWSSARPATIAKAATTLLTDGALRTRVAEFGARLRAGDAAATSAARIEEIARG